MGSNRTILNPRCSLEPFLTSQLPRCSYVHVPVPDIIIVIVTVTIIIVKKIIIQLFHTSRESSAKEAHRSEQATFGGSMTPAMSPDVGCCLGMKGLGTEAGTAWRFRFVSFAAQGDGLQRRGSPWRYAKCQMGSSAAHPPSQLTRAVAESEAIFCFCPKTMQNN